MERDFPLAALCGLVVGLGIYWFLVPDWFVAVATATVYTGAGYFYFAFDVSLLGRTFQFNDRMDRLGYAIGLFGLSVSPLSFAHYYGQQDTATFSFVILFIGVIAFLLFASKAQQQNGYTR